MKFIVATDCDGCACVVGAPGMTLSDAPDYRFSCAQATRESGAAVRALFDAGAEGVRVWDNHGLGANLEFDRLDRRCEVALGAGFGRRWPGLDETFAGVLMIGYHAREGTPGGVLAHTYSPDAYRWIKVNGREVGEMTLDAAVAGALGVPVIFVSSDAAGVEEARAEMPWIETVVTKEGHGRTCALGPHPAVAADAIYDGVRRAVERLGQMKPLNLGRDLEVEIRFKHVLGAWKARLGRRGWHMAGLRSIRRRLASAAEWSA